MGNSHVGIGGSPFTINLQELLDALNNDGLVAKAEAHLLFPTFEVYFDTRSLPQDNARAPFLFIARTQKNFDGHMHVESILARGGWVVAESDKVTAQSRNHPHTILVTDASNAFECILSACVSLKPMQSYAVTGTNGKTSVVQVLKQLLEGATLQPSLCIGTLGIQFGHELTPNPYPTMPDYPCLLQTLHKAQQMDIHTVCLEATSHGLFENRLGRWRIDCGIFTNLSQDHLDYHGSMERYKEAKALLFVKYLKKRGTVVLNFNDTTFEEFFSQCLASQKQLNIIGYGTGTNWPKHYLGHGLSGYLQVQEPQNTRAGISGQWLWHVHNQDPEAMSYAAPIIGSFQHDNISASVAAVLGQKASSLNKLSTLVTQLKPITGRLEVVPVTPEDVHLLPTVIVDYAHSPDALSKALSTCREFTPTNGRLICVFGCGGDRDTSKRPLMGRVAETLADLCFVTSDNPRTEAPHKILNDILSGCADPTKMHADIDRRATIQAAICNASSNDVILIAGKGHENYQILGLEKFYFSDAEISGTILSELRKLIPS